MSHRRELKNAQAAVIEAARDWAKHPSLGLLGVALQDAVAEYERLAANFDADGAASARDTSIAAAKHPRKGSLRYEVCRIVYLRQRPLVEEWKENRGATCDYIERATGRSHQSVSSAVNYAEEHGWIKDSGFRTETRSGAKAIVYEPTGALVDWMRGQLYAEQAVSSG